MRLGLICAALLWSCAAPALAHVQRFAVIAGSDHGRGDDVALSYANTDATRVYEVLRDLGGFEDLSCPSYETPRDQCTVTRMEIRTRRGCSMRRTRSNLGIT